VSNSTALGCRPVDGETKVMVIFCPGRPSVCSADVQDDDAGHH
jgi:hypothetical protein